MNSPWHLQDNAYGPTAPGQGKDVVMVNGQYQPVLSMMVGGPGPEGGVALLQGARCWQHSYFSLRGALHDGTGVFLLHLLLPCTCGPFMIAGCA